MAVIFYLLTKIKHRREEIKYNADDYLENITFNSTH